MAGRDDSRVAYVEDCPSDGVEASADTRQFAHTRARRQSYHGALERAATVRKGDEVSDSGYSSHAGATVASTDLKPESRRRMLERMPKISSKTTVDPAKKKRPTLSHAKTASNSYANETLQGGPSARSPNKSKPKAHSHCDCLECKPLRRTVQKSPLEQPWGLEFPPESSSARRSTEEPPYPYDYRLRPRAVTSSFRAARPTSLFTDSARYESTYPTSSYDSAYARATPLPGPSYMDIPSRDPYAPPLPSYQGSSSYSDYPERYLSTASRSLPQRMSTYEAPRPPTYYESYGEYDNLPTPTWTRRDPADPLYYDSRRDDDYLKMPPPAPRPAPRHTNSTSAAQDIRRRASNRISEAGATVSSERMGRSAAPSAPTTSRRPRLSSTSRAQKTQSYYGGMTTTKVESQSRPRSKSRPRATPYGPEKIHDQERQAEAYQQATGTVPSDGYYAQHQRKVQMPGSSSGSRSRASSSRDEADGRSRGGSRSTNQGVKVSFDRSTGVHLSGIDGHDVTFNSGIDGEQVELIIGKQQYKTVGRSRDGRSSTQSRRSSSKVPMDRAPMDREPQWI
ncbi:MAG: hypothetical protein M4579_000006 [Chaenotheca gracillima]|nr:MAG: hypothetical protein M4579_000006 [Chaenotheca gracillima]